MLNFIVYCPFNISPKRFLSCPPALKTAANKHWRLGKNGSKTQYFKLCASKLQDFTAISYVFQCYSCPWRQKKRNVQPTDASSSSHSPNPSRSFGNGLTFCFFFPPHTQTKVFQISAAGRKRGSEVTTVRASRAFIATLVISTGLLGAGAGPCRDTGGLGAAKRYSSP